MIDFHQAVLKAVRDHTVGYDEQSLMNREQMLLQRLYEDLVWKGTQHSSARQLLFGVYKWRKEAKHAPTRIVG